MSRLIRHGRETPEILKLSEKLEATLIREDPSDVTMRGPTPAMRPTPATRRTDPSHATPATTPAIIRPQPLKQLDRSWSLLLLPLTHERQLFEKFLRRDVARFAEGNPLDHIKAALAAKDVANGGLAELHFFGERFLG